MSRRKLATKSKHSRGPKIAAKAQRVAQAVVRSPKDNRRLSSVGAASTESHPERHNEEEALVGNPMTAFHEPRLEPATALQDEPNNHIQRKDLIFLQPRQTCKLFKRSCWRWHKPTCNLASSSFRGLRRLSRPSNFSVLLGNSRVSGAPCF